MKIKLFIIFNYFIRKNNIFSSLNFIFSMIPEMSSLSIFCFLEVDHLCFLDRRLISYLREKEILSLLNIRKISYCVVFFEKDDLSFSV